MNLYIIVVIFHIKYLFNHYDVKSNINLKQIIVKLEFHIKLPFMKLLI